MSSIKRLIFSRGILGEEIDPSEPPIPEGSAVNFTSAHFPGMTPSCGDTAIIYSSSTRLQQNVITWLNTRTYDINVSHMNYTVYEGLNSNPPDGYYRFSSSDSNIIRLSNGIVQNVIYCP